MKTDTGNEPAVLLSMLSAEAHEVPLGLENFPTEIEVKVGDTKKKVPVAYFDKDVIECGDFVHPSTGRKFSITERRLDDWVEKFDRMKAAGRETPCPVDHSDKAEDNRGFVVKMRREGKKLKSTIQVIGEDGVALAVRNRCSVKFHPQFKDEKGNQWGDCVEHVAFTHIPVIGGQGPFVPIAASRGQQSDAYILSAPKGPIMDLSKLRETLGAAKEVPDEQLLDLAIGEIGKSKKSATDLAAAQTELSRLNDQVTSLSRKPVIDPEVMADRADNYVQKLEISVQKGEMPQTMATKLAGLVKKGEQPVAFSLSRQADWDNKRPIDVILDLFAGEKFGVATGEETAVQLNREVPGDKKDNKPVSPERKAELLQMAGVTPPRA